MWFWIKKNPWIAGAIAALCLGVLASAHTAWRFHGQMRAAKESEKVAGEKIKALTKEAEAKDAAYQKAIGATEPALRNALAGVREARANLAQVEASRRGLWMAPAVDNGDLVARFERALEAIR